MKQFDGRERKRNAYLSLLYFAIIFLPVFLLGCYLYNAKLRIGQFEEIKTHSLQDHINPPQRSVEDKDKKIDLVPLDVCDVFTGKWVLDNVTHPLYKEDECEFLSEWVACTRNGRPDSKYQKWRWQPRDCSLPRFQGKLLLDKLRGKKLMFIGDSIHYNQWQSMVCMVQSIILSGKKTLKHTAQMSIFNIEEYNATIAFYWAPFLVESNADPPDKRDGKTDPIIMPQSISKHGENWKDADYLVFNSYIWWTRHSKIKVLRNQGSFNQGDSKEYDEIGIYIVYKQVLSTWTNWLEQNIDTDRKSIFFSSMSPTHIRSSDWGLNGGSKCEKETEPILNMSRSIDVGTNQRLYEIAVNVTKSTKVPIQFLNITTMSEYRKDGHTTFYGSSSGKLITPEQRLDPRTFADCYHWCLPGVPDTWNELLSLAPTNKTLDFDYIGKVKSYRKRHENDGEEICDDKPSEPVS